MHFRLRKPRESARDDSFIFTATAIPSPIYLLLSNIHALELQDSVSREHARSKMTKPRSNKRQTRLAFTPLSSSSPLSGDNPEQLKDRAAVVRYEDLSSPSKRRKVTDTSRQGATNSPLRPLVSHAIESESDNKPLHAQQALPTPEVSSQVAPISGDDDGMYQSELEDQH